MDDNIFIENIQFTEELFKKAIEEEEFKDELFHGIGDDINGNS